jgi:hypothetical protein
MAACIPSKAIRKVPVPHDTPLYNRLPQDRDHVREAQGLAPHPHRSDRCAYTFMSAICIAATVLFWLNQ